MSYNLKERRTLYAVHLQANQTTLSVGDTVPYAILNGTSGHGVTVSSGVMTLPKGEWLVHFRCESVDAKTWSANIYVDSIQNTTFPTISSRRNASLSHGSASTNQTNLDTTAIPLKSTGSTTIELRIISMTNSSETFSDCTDCLIYGFKI